MCLALLGGCTGRPANPQTADVVFFVPGAAGDGGQYDGLVRGLRAGGVAERLEVVTWGVPGPLFFMNFQSPKVHDAAEEKLAGTIAAWRAAHPAGRIGLIAHSAGCGVVLGGLRREGTQDVGTVILLSPSVSPGYDLAGALARIGGVLHVFRSERDTFFLSWRTGTFGTYDNVKTKAAGNVGFAVSPAARGRVVQHAWEEGWVGLGNDGGHFGATSEEFVRRVVAPLLVP